MSSEIDRRLREIEELIYAEGVRLMQKRQLLYTLKNRLYQIQPMITQFRLGYYELIGNRAMVERMRELINEAESISRMISRLEEDIAKEEARIYQLRVMYSIYSYRRIPTPRWRER